MLLVVIVIVFVFVVVVTERCMTALAQPAMDALVGSGPEFKYDLY